MDRMVLCTRGLPTSNGYAQLRDLKTKIKINDKDDDKDDDKD